MNIQQLESFLWVARLGSVTEACKRLHVTQSTLSMRIKALETDLRITLFDRAHKRLTLTAKGRDLVRYAEKIVATIKQVETYVADPAAQSGTIRVGVAELIALTWGAALFRQISILYPKVIIDLDIGVPRPLTDALANGALDVVLAPILGEPKGPFPSLPLGRVAFSWVASPALQLNVSQVTPSDLEQLEIIGVAGNQSVIHWTVQQWFADHGATMHHHNVCNSLAATAAIVMEGLGVSLLPDVYCAPYVEAGRLMVLPTDKQFSIEFYACYSALNDQALPRQVAELAREISTFPAPPDQTSKTIARKHIAE
jgi:DNA-binding transcriptional LysR family regulator